MKRTIALILSLLLVLSLFAGCGKDKKVSTNDLSKLQEASGKTDNQAETPADTTKPADVTKPETADSPKEEGIRFIGEWDGNKFNNKWSGVKFTMPEDYEPEDMSEYNDIAEDAALEDYEELDEVFDTIIWKETDDLDIGMAIMYSKLNGRNIDDYMEEYIRDDLTYMYTLTDSFTRKIGGETYTAIDGYSYDEDGIYDEFSSVNYRKVDDYAVLIMFDITDWECLGTPQTFYDAIEEIYPDVKYTTDFVSLPDNENMAGSENGWAYYPGEWDDESYYSGYTGLYFNIPDGWTVCDEDGIREMLGDDCLVGDDYLDANTIDMIGEFIMYKEDEEAFMLMFVNASDPEFEGMTNAEFVEAVANEMDCEILYDGDITGIADYDARYVDCDGDGTYYTIIGFKCDDGMFCYITLFTCKENRLDSLFDEIFA